MDDIKVITRFGTRTESGVCAIGDVLKLSALSERIRIALRFTGIVACAAVLSLSLRIITGLFSGSHPMTANPGEVYSANSDQRSVGKTYSANQRNTDASLNIEATEEGDMNPEGVTFDETCEYDPAMPEFYNERLTLDAARVDPNFGAFLPTDIPAGFNFACARRFINKGRNRLSAIWNARSDYINWDVAKVTDYDLDHIVTASELEKYDLSLYPIPLVRSVPVELWEHVNNPVFPSEELTLNVIKKRASYVNADRGDTPGWRMDFSVLYGDVIVRVNIKGALPEQVWGMFAGLMIYS